MQPYEPAGYNGDINTLRTIYNGYIPSSSVSDLSNQISTPNSLYFTGLSGIQAQLADFTEPAFPVIYSVDKTPPSSPGGSDPDSPNSKKKKTIIIAVVCSVIGVTILLAIGWWARVARNSRRQRESIRQRLRERYTNYATFDSRDMRESIPSVVDISPGPSPGRRRNSFYYADESLRNYFAEHGDLDEHRTGVIDIGRREGQGRDTYAHRSSNFTR
jgi:hypothetical protein